MDEITLFDASHVHILNRLVLEAYKLYVRLCVHRSLFFIRFGTDALMKSVKFECFM